jgi:glycosyltransferase involved in cell wall biosynthesis
MNKPQNTFIILSPAFAEYEGDSWLPAPEQLVLAMNRSFPSLRIVILTFHFPERAIPAYEWYENEVISFSGGMKGGKLGSLLRWKRVWTKLNELRTQHSIVGLFSLFCSECAFVGHYFAKRYHLPHHIWVLGQDARKDNKQVRRIRPSAGELVCISDFLVREFTYNHHVRPAHVIPFGINTELYAPPSRVRNIDLLGAGSLIPLKQYDIFIEVVRRISYVIPDVSALVCGDGPEQERLQAIIKTANLKRQLRLGGKQAHAELLQTMQRARIFLHTSSYEGLGAVCLEALYAGAHVVSFCKPLDAAIPHWHIVQTADEMVETAIGLLVDEGLDHTPVLPYRIEDIAMAVMRLYNYNPDITS